MVPFERNLFGRTYGWTYVRVQIYSPSQILGSVQKQLRLQGVGGGVGTLFKIETPSFYMLQSCLSSFQNVLILDLETLGSKVMNKNVRQGFCCWRKSLIFCRGIFRMKKLQFFSNNSLENASNHLKIDINHPQDVFKKFVVQIFEILIFRDFSHL